MRRQSSNTEIVYNTSKNQEVLGQSMEQNTWIVVFSIFMIKNIKKI